MPPCAPDAPPLRGKRQTVLLDPVATDHEQRAWLKNHDAVREMQRAQELQRAQEGLPRPWEARRSSHRGEIYYAHPGVDGGAPIRTYTRPRPVGATDANGWLKMQVHTAEAGSRAGAGSGSGTTPPPPPTPGEVPPWSAAPDWSQGDWGELEEPLEQSGDAAASEPCPYFGSEAGCSGSSCPFSHAEPNSVPLCPYQGSCLRTACCTKRHREWVGWEEAVCYYRRLGPYHASAEEHRSEVHRDHNLRVLHSIFGDFYL